MEVSNSLANSAACFPTQPILRFFAEAERVRKKSQGRQRGAPNLKAVNHMHITRTFLPAQLVIGPHGLWGSQPRTIQAIGLGPHSRLTLLHYSVREHPHGVAAALFYNRGQTVQPVTCVPKCRKSGHYTATFEGVGLDPCGR